MLDSAAAVLLMGAATTALLHTLVGVDHYLPFVLIGKARGWPLRRTLGLTALCGVGHVLGSMLLGLIGIAAGVAVGHMELIEGTRGSLAAWSLIGFGLLYAGVSAVRTARGGHHHCHPHPHPHPDEAGAGPDASISKWSLFIIFVLGPCEALIPLFIVPAAEHNWPLVLAVAGLFSGVTILTMVASVAVVSAGLSKLSLPGLERHANTMAGLAIAVSGLAIQLLGI